MNLLYISDLVEKKLAAVFVSGDAVYWIRLQDNNSILFYSKEYPDGLFYIKAEQTEKPIFDKQTRQPSHLCLS